VDHRWHATRRFARHPRTANTARPPDAAPAPSVPRLRAAPSVGAYCVRPLPRVSGLRRQFHCRDSAPPSRIEPCRRDPTYINDTIRREHSPPSAHTR